MFCNQVVYNLTHIVNNDGLTSENDFVSTPLSSIILIITLIDRRDYPSERSIGLVK